MPGQCLFQKKPEQVLKHHARLHALCLCRYRPEHMAIICIGDMRQEPADVVGLIRTTFEGGSSRDTSVAPSIPVYPTFIPHSQPRVAVFADRESSAPAVYVSFKCARAPLSSLKDLLAHLEVRWVGACIER